MGMPWSIYSDEISKALFNWVKVRYEIDGYSEEALSTLPVLYNYISSSSGVIKNVTAIVQETAIAKKLDLCKGYESIVSTVRDMYERFIASQGLKSRVDIIVAPGCGRFLNRFADGDRHIDIHICGNVADFFYYIFMKLSSILLNVVNENTEKLIVHLDLSHGVNYMPTLTRAALMELLPIVATYSTFQKVVLKVYNSEPVMRNALKESYTIHVVEEVIFKNNNIYHFPPIFEGINQPRFFTVNKQCYIEPSNLAEIGKEITKSSNQIIEELNLTDIDRVNAFAGSLINGLPLLALESIPHANLEQFIDKVIREYKGFTSITYHDGGNIIINISRRASISSQVKALTKILLAKELIARHIEEMYIHEKGVSLKQLEKIIKRLYSWNSRLKITINSDYHTIKKMLDEKGFEQWTRLIEILEAENEMNCKEELEKLDRFGRNFLQHSGLHRCITEVKVERAEEGKVARIRYIESITSNTKLRKKVYEIATKGIVKI